MNNNKFFTKINQENPTNKSISTKLFGLALLPWINKIFPPLITALL